ncbi:putative RING finger protein 4 [Dirofilaria immitis]|nr:putative RING finger protein 4 [Dirofilaria immitis]
MTEYWKHVWQSSEVLGDYISAHHYLFERCVVLELGAGCTGIPGLVAAKCGADLVIFTDHPESKEAFNILEQNCIGNDLNRNSFLIRNLDWNEPNFNQILDDVLVLHYILAADVFYDITVFGAFLHTVGLLLQQYPKATCIFAYEERNSNWSIEDLLLLNELCCRRIRVIDTDLHTIHIGIIISKREKETNNARHRCPTASMKHILYNDMVLDLLDPDTVVNTKVKDVFEMLIVADFMEASRIFAGIEGGATQSRLIFIDETGKRYGEWSQSGLNYCLDGFDIVADRIAKWIQMAKKSWNCWSSCSCVTHFQFLIKGMGLSGAEDKENNQKLIDLLKDQHGDIAVEFSLSSDAVVAVATSFQNGGVVIVAGTGSTCRLLKADNSVHGVGGWGHQIGDGGSAFWIARRIASFTAHVAKEANDDPLIRHVFHEAGEQLGLHLRAISTNFDEAMFDDAPVLLIGSVWQSWELLKDGFINGIKSNGSRIKQVTLYTLLETPALGAAILAAKKLSKTIACEQRTAVFECVWLHFILLCLDWVFDKLCQILEIFEHYKGSQEMNDDILEDGDVIPGQSWIMCNMCFRSASISLSHIVFYLTKCGHIFCDKCLIGIASFQDMACTCLYCKKKVTVCRISRHMPQTVPLPAVQTYFRCPRELLIESMVEIMQVIRFQTTHAACLVKRFSLMQTNYEKLRRFCCKILDEKATLERELASKVGLSKHNNTANNMSTPLLPPVTSAKNLHSTQNIETPKTPVTSENVSKSGTESSVIENSTSSLSESMETPTSREISISSGILMEVHVDEGNNVNNKYIISDVELSKIVLFENIRRSLVERTAGTLLRPIVIDGPLIGASYDQKYAVDDRIGCTENYARRIKPTRKGYRFLTDLFDEQLDEPCCSRCALVNNIEQFRELLLLKLIKFLPNENFGNEIKRHTANCHGILVTSAEALYFNNSNLLRKDCLEESTISGSAMDTSCDLMYSTMIPEIQLDKSKLPVIIPIFRPYNHRLIISLDFIRWKKILQVEERELNISQYKLLVDEQLELRSQFKLLKKLASMLDGQFPCGPSDADIVPLFRHALGLADQAISFSGPS